MELFFHCAIKRSLKANVHDFAVSKSVTVYTLRTEARIQNLKHFVCKKKKNSILSYFSKHKALPDCLLTVLKVSVVRLIESIVTVKWLKNSSDKNQVSVLQRCPLTESWLYSHWSLVCTLQCGQLNKDTCKTIAQSNVFWIIIIIIIIIMIKMIITVFGTHYALPQCVYRIKIYHGLRLQSIY